MFDKQLWRIGMLSRVLDNLSENNKIDIIRGVLITILLICLYVSIQSKLDLDHTTDTPVNNGYSVTEFDQLPSDLKAQLEEEDRKDNNGVVFLPRAQPRSPVLTVVLADTEPVYPTEKVTADSIFEKATSGMSKKEKAEIACIAYNVYFEAGKEPFTGKVAVGNVTNKRKDSRFWESSYCGVVKAGYEHKGQIGSCQFSWYCDGKHDKIYLYSKYKDNGVIKYELNKKVYTAWVHSIKVAIEQYIGQAEDVTGGATHYYNPKVCYKSSVRIGDLCHPKWAAKGLANGTMVLAQSPYLMDGRLGNHLFLVELRAHRIVNAGLTP